MTFGWDEKIKIFCRVAQKAELLMGVRVQVTKCDDFASSFLCRLCNKCKKKIILGGINFLVNHCILLLLFLKILCKYDKNIFLLKWKHCKNIVVGGS